MTWYLAKNLVAAPGMPRLVTSISRKASLEGWSKRLVSGVKGQTFEYHIDSLPLETQKHLRKIEAEKSLKTIVSKFSIEDVIAEKNAEEKLKREEDLKALACIDDERRQKAIVRAQLVTLYYEFKTSNKLGRGSNAMVMFVNAVRSLELPYAAENKDVIDMTRLSTQMLYRWIRLKSEKGIAALALEENRSKPKMGRSLIGDQPELAEFISAVIVEYPTTTPRKMETLLKARFGDTAYQLPKRTTIREWMTNWKTKNASALTYMVNPDKWRNEFMVAHGNSSERATQLNGLWELDATPGDIECVWEGNRKRVHLSGVIDVYSRRLQLLVTETPRTEANAMLMRRALIDWGKPIVCKTDNGSDYVSARMKQTFVSLSIEQELCTPFHPQEKPHIERVFRTFSHDWLEMQPGYVGHNVAERKGIEARKSFANRLMQRGDVIEARMSPQELQVFCDKWLQIYHHRTHAALDCSPFERASTWNGVIERIPDERALDMLLAEPAGGNGKRKVAKKGVKVDNIWYISPELIVGNWVHVYYDESDIGRLVIYNDEHEFLCIAEAPDLVGVSRKELASAAKRKQNQQMQKAAQAAREARSKHNIRDLAEEVMDYELAKSNNVAAFPPKEAEFTSSTLSAGRDAHDALVQFDQPSKGSNLSQAEIDKLQAEIVEMDIAARKLQSEYDSEEGKFLRWIELTEALECGEPLDEFNANWMVRYERSSEFKGRKMIFDDWGKSAFINK